jgi:hypothetical protein
MFVLPILLLAVLPATVSGQPATDHRLPTTAPEICRFRAGDRENPFRRWFASGDVVCSTTPTFPPGLWNVFARSADGVSRVPVVVEGGAAPALTPEPAAMLVPLLPPQTRAVVYVPKLGVAFPVADRALVPADHALWLFVLQQSKPLGVFPIGPFAAGTEQRIDARGAAPPAVIGWLSVPEADRAALRNARGLSTPPVFARVAGTTRDSDLLPPLDALNGAFVRIANVPAGDGDVLLQGRGWMTDRHRVKVDAALTAIATPLNVRAAGSFTLGWSIRQDLIELDRSLGSCGEGDKAPKGELTISICTPPERGNVPEPSTCSAIRTEPFDPAVKMGSFSVDEIPPGLYRVDVKYGKLPAVATSALVGPLQHARMSLYLEFDEIYGTVTRGGEPLGEDAVLTFPAGYGFATAEKSEYRAVLRDIGNLRFDAPVTVAACDGDPRTIVLNDRPATRNARLDIDIPANALTITVEDTFTRDPLVGATINMEVLSGRSGRPTAASRTLKTSAGDSEAQAVARAIPPDHPLAIEVSHPGYQKQRLDRFSLTKSEEKTVHVQLVPLRGDRGKLVSQRAFEEAVILWFSAAGREIDRADVAADGTFVFTPPHDPSETMAVVSASHPLWVARSPQTKAREATTIAFPDTAAVRTFDAVFPGGDPRITRQVSLVIGGIRVPAPALRQHQMLRRAPVALRGAAPMPIRDLAETGPIDVILGGDVNDRTASEAPPVRLMPGVTRLELRAN